MMLIILSRNNEKRKFQKKLRKKNKVRAKIKKLGKYRLTVYKSLRHIYAQIFTYDGKHVIVSASSLEKNIFELTQGKNKKEVAFLVGKYIADRARKCEIKEVAFDSSGFCYHGRIQILADSARKYGLSF